MRESFSAYEKVSEYPLQASERALTFFYESPVLVHRLVNLFEEGVPLLVGIQNPWKKDMVQKGIGLEDILIISDYLSWKQKQDEKKMARWRKERMWQR